MWEAVEIDADAIRWLIRRNIHVRPLLSVDEAVAVLESASEATTKVIAERLRLSGSHDEVKVAVLARLGVGVHDVADAGLDARRSMVYELREAKETWAAIAEALEIGESTARNDYRIWSERVR
jgi:hypothetical protein